MYQAVMHSTRHYYEDDGGGSQSSSDVVDTDLDLDVLRDRVNAYYAQPKVIDFFRNRQFVIPPGEMRSNRTYAEGGGCGGSHYIVLGEAPRLKVEA